MKFICLAHNPPFPLPHILYQFTEAVVHTGTHMHLHTSTENELRKFPPAYRIHRTRSVQVHSTFYFNSIYLIFFFCFSLGSLWHTFSTHKGWMCVFNIGIDKTRLTKRSLFLISFWFVPWPRQKILHRMFSQCPRSTDKQKDTRLSEQKLEHTAKWCLLKMIIEKTVVKCVRNMAFKITPKIAR